jgi:hypothetical protein
MRDDLIGLPHNPSPPDPDERLNRLAVYRYIKTIQTQLENLADDFEAAHFDRELEFTRLALTIMDDVIESIERREATEFS